MEKCCQWRKCWSFSFLVFVLCTFCLLSFIHSFIHQLTKDLCISTEHSSSLISCFTLSNSFGPLYYYCDGIAWLLIWWVFFEHFTSTYRHKVNFTKQYTISSLVKGGKFDCCYCYPKLHIRFHTYNQIELHCTSDDEEKKRKQAWASHLKCVFYSYHTKKIFSKKIKNPFQT